MKEQLMLQFITNTENQGMAFTGQEGDEKM